MEPNPDHSPNQHHDLTPLPLPLASGTKTSTKIKKTASWTGEGQVQLFVVCIAFPVFGWYNGGGGEGVICNWEAYHASASDQVLSVHRAGCRMQGRAQLGRGLCVLGFLLILFKHKHAINLVLVQRSSDYLKHKGIAWPLSNTNEIGSAQGFWRCRWYVWYWPPGLLGHLG